MVPGKVIVMFGVLTGIIIKDVCSRKERVETVLRKKIFNEYDKNIRPTYNQSHAVNLTVDLALFQIIKLNEKEQTLEVSAWLRQTWCDPELAWDPENFSGIKQLSKDAEDMWLPNTVLQNSVMEDNEVGGHLDKLQTRVIILHTGEIKWMTSAILKTHCDIMIRHFPFDSQTCDLKIVSWTYDQPNLVISASHNRTTMDTGSFEKNSVWKLVNTSVTVTSEKYSCCEEPYSLIKFRIHVARRSLFYLLNLIFPISVITLLTILSFLLPAESGERISLAVTLLLAVTFIMLIVADTTPATSQEIPLVSLYFIISMLDMAILMVTVCYVNRLHHKETTDGPMGSWTRTFILNKLSYIVGIQKRMQPQPKQNHQLVDAHHKTEETRLVSDTKKIIEHRDPRDDHCCNGKFTSSRIFKSTNNAANVDESEVGKEFAQIIEQIIDAQISPKIDKLVERVENAKEDDAMKIEWRIVAMTVDRCLLIFFLINFVFTLIGVFSLSPGYVA